MKNIWLEETDCDETVSPTTTERALCGAVILAETIESAINNLSMGQLMIVLMWKRIPQRYWSTIVAHRVTKIVE
ncbi:unnamed protein product [Ceratitis capitata]|uniref:(Mediterranean fruit fly) hypothetical protein n=1 Tax=Ceratitis capitata TaxID=7213 RepID=A0A811UT83_CERCA|nr:unnamed protein product [Ceratitis capitata]